MDMDEVYRLYSKMVFHYLLSRTKNRDLAEEITQETFYQAMLSSNSFKNESSLSTWLCAIARNQLNTWYRKHPVQEEVDDSYPELVKKREHLELLEKIHQLPEPYREILYLRMYGNLTFPQISSILKKSENYARVMFYRGKNMLKEELEKDEN